MYKKIKNRKDFVKAVESVRKSEGLGLTEFCSKVGMSRMTYWRFRTDESIEMRFETYIRIMVALGMELVLVKEE